MNDDRLWDRWQEVDSLLEQALDLPPEAREEFLAGACGGDAELLGLVRGLIRDVEAASDPGGPSPGLVRAALQEPGWQEGALPLDDLTGTTLGPYRLERVLGRGGMATVYLAQRVDGVFQRQVAVKVLRGAGALELTDRSEGFQRERRILASLSHPGIAQLLDGGVSGQGRPYLVMEHVDGRPIDAYAHGQGLGVRARVELVVQAAGAVEYAHRHMVVHRDLKPSNMLVTHDGQVKLLDFGIAKLLEAPKEAQGADDAGPGAPSPSPPTRAEARYATPEYAAPELLLGEAVSTQTDVYGLAAVLFELLTGARPWSGRGRESLLERVVRGEAPTVPAGLVPQDLEAILQRGLQARPEQRYPSVEALRDDLERYLSGQAVLARGDARLYRARRFMRRHRWPLTAAAGVFLVVAGSAVGLLVQRGALVEERNRANAAAATAAREAETAHQVTGFLVDLFAAGDPEAERSDTLTVAALVERGTARVDADLAGQPAVQAELLDVLGQVQANLGHYERADSLLVRAVALRRDSVPDRLGLAETLAWLGEIRRNARDFPAATAAYRDGLDEALRAGDRRGAARIRLGMAQTWVQQDATDSARVAFQDGLAWLAQAEDSTSAAYQNALVGLAGLVRRDGDLEGAADLYTQAVALLRGQAGEDPMALAVGLNNLAVTRRMQGRLDEAVPLYREAYDTAVAVLGAGHPNSLLLLGNLARVWIDLGQMDASIDAFATRVAGAREQWPQGHWRLAETLMQLGGALVMAGRPREALAPLDEAVEMAAAELGPAHSWTAVYRGWWAAAAILSGDAAAGEEALRRSLADLSSYAGLSQDTNVRAMIEALVTTLDQRGLTGPAARYRELLGGP